MSRLVIGAPSSGCGKTTVTCALLEVLRRRGENPSAFKCGPDYIDPMFHWEIIGVPSHNLDFFLMGESAVRRLLRDKMWNKMSNLSGISVIEGAMGYYDGVGAAQGGSAYDLARSTATPAVLVVDGRGAALSLCALIHGFCSFRPESGVEGVILNRVSPRRYPQMKACIEAETGVKVCGFLPSRPDFALESRHLGLVTAAEVKCLRQKLDALADEAEKSLDVEGLLALARSAPALEASESRRPKPAGERVKIAVARDRAFCFYYEDALSLLEDLGAELVPFSPLTDPSLPEGCAGLYLGGGYPELYAQTLSENAAMRSAVRAAVLGGMPCIAECGGFLYLHKTLEGADGKCWPMAGVFPLRAYRTERLQRFGYAGLTARRDNLLCGAGDTLPAHEFHYWESEDPGDAFLAQKPQSDRSWPCVHAAENLYAGFPHLHLSGCPEAARRFVEACGTPR